MAILRKKLVVVGDDGSGKTCMLMNLRTRLFPTEFTPTVFGDFVTTMRLYGRQVELESWDTPSDDQWRTLHYNATDVVLICFAIDSPASLVNVKEKWFPEIRFFVRKRPYFLVGCKKDLRDGRRRSVSVEEGTAAARELGASYYMECSAKAGEGVTEIFELAARTALQSEDIGGCMPGGSGCVLQ